VYGETGDGRIDFGERDSHGGVCGSLVGMNFLDRSDD
jgi:hypothetical protein